MAFFLNSLDFLFFIFFFLMASLPLLTTFRQAYKMCVH